MGSLTHLAAVADSMWNQFTLMYEFVFLTFCLHVGTPVCVVSNPGYNVTNSKQQADMKHEMC